MCIGWFSDSVSGFSDSCVLGFPTHASPLSDSVRFSDLVLRVFDSFSRLDGHPPSASRPV